MKRHSKRAANHSPDSATKPDTLPVVAIPPTPYAGRPLDGSHYIEVIEEQEYSELRPTAEEQRPRYAFRYMFYPQREE